MRYAEFSAIGDRMALESEQRILDVSSPQWFTIFLAHKYPNVHFDYILTSLRWRLKHID